MNKFFLCHIEFIDHFPHSMWWFRRQFLQLKWLSCRVMSYCCCHWHRVRAMHTHIHALVSFDERVRESVCVLCARIFSAINYSASGGAPPAALCHKNNYSRSPAIKVDLWAVRRTKSAARTWCRVRSSHNNYCAQVSLNRGENVGTNYLSTSYRLSQDQSGPFHFQASTTLKWKNSV